MTSLPVYVRDRVAELRSRLSLLESSLMDLKHDFWTVFDSFISKDCTPPYIFPTSTFNRLETVIDSLKTGLYSLEPDDITDVMQLNDLSEKAEGILFELRRLQDVFVQRVSGLGIMRLFEFQPILEIEYSAIAKAYNAVDALTFELVKKTLGDRWVTENKYTPICLFGSSYMINVRSYVISIPYNDSFRSRFWPALAHEVAHIFVYIMAERLGVFRDKMLDGISRLMEMLGFDFDDRVGRRIVSLQMSELTSDIISTYICPPSFLTGAGCFDFPIETPRGLAEKVKFSHHPPTDSRLIAMERVLEQNGLMEVDKDLQKAIRSVRRFFFRKNVVMISQESFDRLRSYNRFAKSYSESILQVLPQIGLKALDGNEWNLISDALVNQNPNELTPVQLTCLTWMKRFKVTKGDGALNIRSYFEKRRTEPKIFDDNIRLMYNYYEKEICEKLAKVGLYDTCISVS